MGKLRSGQQLRLTGKDAEEYLTDTGRATLPKTVQEHNTAHQQSADTWRAAGCPEGDFLAMLNESEKIEG